MKIRVPTVAGAFYEGEPESLRQSISDCFSHRLGPGQLPEAGQARAPRLLGMVSPHAGFIYSGPAAAWGFGALAAAQKPELAVLLGTNHRMAGAAIAVDTAEAWMTPLGKLEVDAELRKSLVAKATVTEDDTAHEYEHSIEVQLPWLRYLYGSKCKILPISMGQPENRALTALAASLAEQLESKNAVVIASSDFSHYVPHETAEALDRGAIEKILSLDAEGLLAEVREKMISMCGAIPVATMLETCRALGARQAKQLAYYTSGDITGDKGAVVGYASLIIER